MIESHIAQGRYPGAQIALARHGKLALYEAFGRTSLNPATLAGADTLWLLFSNTKVITAVPGIWALVEDGRLRFSDRIAEHIPEFAPWQGRHHAGAGHQPSRRISQSNRLKPGVDRSRADAARSVRLHARVDARLAAALSPEVRVLDRRHLIEAVTKGDYRDFPRQRIIEPLGLARDVFVGLPDAEHGRVATIHEPGADGAQNALADEKRRDWRAGIPSSGGFATARGMAALYQMMVNGGRLNGTRLLSRRLIEFVTRNHTDEMVDGGMEMPMHRGLGVHVRGTTETIRGLGSLASPRTFGHGGVGSSYCWGDPDSGVSFAYLTNSRIPDPWHSSRLDLVANLVHSAIL